MDRGRLGSIVFADPAALHDLEQIVHPAVITETLRRLQDCTEPVAVIEAIKLLEAEMHTYCDAVWVVVCTRRQQVERLVSSRGMGVIEAELRIDAQPPAEAKVVRSDVVIDNSGHLDNTRQQVLEAWNQIPGIPQASSTQEWQPVDGQR